MSEAQSGQPIRVLIVGSSGTGKTTRAGTMYLKRFPRVMIIDRTGEWDNKATRYAVGLQEFTSAITNLSSYSAKWTVSGDLDDDEIAPLVDWLIPRPVTASPIVAMKGAALLLDEVDLVAPSSAPRHVRTLFRRSRHVGLSVISCTQRPANVSREVTAQSTHVLVHRLNEPRDRDYMFDLLQWSYEEQVLWSRFTHEQQHGAVLFDMAQRRGWTIDNGGNAKALPPRIRQGDMFDAPEA